MAAMYDWVSVGETPPPSRYPRIADGTLVASHADDRVNRDAWNRMSGVNHPASMYQPLHTSYGSRWDSERIIDQHPEYSDHYYQSMVPMVNTDNNDLPGSTILTPLTSVPLGTFVSWNLRAPETGAERSLARLSGGYIPFPANTAVAVQSRDPRNSIAGLYPSYDEYLDEFEAATDALISEGFLLPGFKQAYMNIAESYSDIFE